MRSMTERSCKDLLYRVSLAIKDPREVAVRADGDVLTQDIMYKVSSTGALRYEWLDGRPVEDNVLAGLASMGALG